MGFGNNGEEETKLRKEKGRKTKHVKLKSYSSDEEEGEKGRRGEY